MPKYLLRPCPCGITVSVKRSKEKRAKKIYAGWRCPGCGRETWYRQPAYPEFANPNRVVVGIGL